MRAPTKEWIDKADDDWRVARREINAAYRPSYNIVGFHCQQCAEKYLKAYLQECGVAFPYNHDLKGLLSLCATVDGLFAVLQFDLEILNDYSVGVRYPGDNIGIDEAREAVKAMERVRKFVRKKLGLR